MRRRVVRDGVQEVSSPYHTVNIIYFLTTVPGTEQVPKYVLNRLASGTSL